MFSFLQQGVISICNTEFAEAYYIYIFFDNMRWLVMKYIDCIAHKTPHTAAPTTIPFRLRVIKSENIVKNKERITILNKMENLTKTLRIRFFVNLYPSD